MWASSIDGARTRGARGLRAGAFPESLAEHRLSGVIPAGLVRVCYGEPAGL